MERVQAASRPGEADVRSFFDDSPVLIAVANAEGRFVRVGGPWTPLFGWSHEELTAVPCFDFIHPDDIGPTEDLLVGLNAGRPAVAFRNRYRTKHGTWIWLQWHAHSNAAGEILAVGTDITDVVAREHELSRRRRAFEIVVEYQRRALAGPHLLAGIDDAIAAAAELIGAESAAVVTIETTDRPTRRFEGVASFGAEVFCAPGDHLAVIESVEFADGDRPTMLEAASVVTRFGRPIITSWTDGHVDANARELLVVPLTRDRTIGLGVFVRDTGSFTLNDVEVLAPVLASFARAIELDRTASAETRMAAELTRLSSMLGTMLERTQFMVVVTDAHGRVEMLNDTAARLLGGRAAADDHRSVDELLAPNRTSASLAASLIAFEGRAEESSWTFADAAGRPIEVVITASPISAEAGDLRGWMLIGRTAEERVRAERERIERARLAAQVELLQRREQQLAALADATQYVMASHTHREALDVIDHFLPAAFGPGRTALRRVAGASRFGHVADPDVLQANECWAIRTGRTFHSEPGAAVRCAHVDADRRAICAPIGDGRVWSAVIVWLADPSDDAAVSAAGESLVDDVARQLSNAMSNLRLRRALEEQAYRDPLTGVGNRRAAEQALETAGARQRSHGEPFAVVMVDLDHFKEINDRHGHEIGDDVLVAFAEFLRTHVREDDRVTRIGGEEFLLILRDIPSEVLERTLDALRVGVAALPVGPGLHITASFGGVHVTDHDATTDELVATADQLMYAAKHGGRDRVEVAAWTDRRTTMRNGR